MIAHSSGENPAKGRKNMDSLFLVPAEVVLGMVALAASAIACRVVLRLAEETNSRPRLGILLAGMGMSAFLAMNGITWLWYGTWLWNTPNLF